jgi:hypothetical protein
METNDPAGQEISCASTCCDGCRYGIERGRKDGEEGVTLGGYLNPAMSGYRAPHDAVVSLQHIAKSAAELLEHAC